MPDISKINALAIGSVAKVDGLAKASILDIDGVAVPSAVGTPAGAYSVRLLGSGVGISSYTGDCMRVRRASDNVEADIAFDAGELKLTSGVSNTSDALSYTDFADFVDHTGTPTDAFVRYWYDQSGNSRDAGQSTAGNQPQIYDATTGLLTENGKPILRHDSGHTHLNLSFAGNSTAWMFTVTELTNNLSILLSDSNTFEFIMAARDNDTTTQASIPYSNIYKNGSSVTYTDQNSVYDDIILQQALHVLQMNTSNVASYELGFSKSTPWVCYDMQEIIIYHSDESSNRTGIETNINGYFSIYT